MTRVSRRRKGPGRPAKPLTREQVVAGALAVVDAEGPEALTMRRLAQQLGVQAASLYHHLPHKSALEDAVYEALLARHLPPVDAALGWEDQLRAMGRALQALFVAFPAGAGLFAARPPTTPVWLAHAEACFAALERAGFAPASARYAHLSVVALAAGLALAEREGRPAFKGGAPAREGPPDPVAFAARFPSLARLIAASPANDHRAWQELALNALIEGLRVHARPGSAT